MSEKQIIFVVGCPRSGTTLLRDILISDKRIAIPDDELQMAPRLIKALNNNSLSDVISLLKKSPFGYFNPNFDFDQLDIPDGDLSSKWCDLFAQLTFNEGAHFYGEKTPDNYRHLKVLGEYFPNAKFLFVIRDPRDVVVSMRKAWGKSYIFALMKWKAAYKQCKVNDCDTDIHVVLYEQLLQDSQHALKQVGDWLSCSDLEHEALKNFVQSKEVYGDSKGKKGIVSTNRKKYLESCPKFALYSIECLLNKEMKGLGYQPEFVEKRTGLLIGFFIYSVWDVPFSFIRTVTSQIKHKGLVNGIKYKLLQVANKYGHF